MEIHCPGDEVRRAWPEGSDSEDCAWDSDDCAWFVFKVPDFKRAKEIVRLLMRVRQDEMSLYDAARQILGMTLERVENLKNATTGAEIQVEKEGSQLSEKCAGELAPLFDPLVGLLSPLLTIREIERKNF